MLDTGMISFLNIIYYLNSDFTSSYPKKSFQFFKDTECPLKKCISEIFTSICVWNIYLKSKLPENCTIHSECIVLPHCAVIA